MVTLLITHFITTHEPPSMGLWETAFGFLGSALRSGSGGPGKSGQQQTAAQVDSYRGLYKFRV